MTVGFYSPMPPVRSGVADYAAALVSALRTHGNVEVHPCSRRFRPPRTGENACPTLYHLGNNRLHTEIYRLALERAGVVVLHDAVLQHFFLGTLGESAYIEEFCYNYGEWTRGLARELWQGRASSGLQSRYFEYPMLKRVAERARAVVVHNPGAAEIVRAHAPAARVVEIPHLHEAAPVPSPTEAQAFRRRLGIPPAAFTFGIFGYLRESKRLFSVFEVFARLRRENPRTALLVAGDFVSTDLARAAAPLLAAPGVFRVPYLPGHGFRIAAAAVDACINLRYPGAGETSGITIRLMGAGKPVLLSEGPETARFPEDACLRVARGPGERDSLWHQMFLLTSCSDARREIGLRGAAHIAREHSAEGAARLYWKTLCECMA